MGKYVSAEEALQKIVDVHGDTYDLSKFVYTGAKNKVVVICRKHGEFKQRYADLKSGAGCNLCGIDRQREKLSRPFEDFEKRAKETHGDKYTYIKDGYVNLKSKVKIICPTHGEFLQVAGKHIEKSGCPSCQKNGFNRAKVGTLYLLSNGEFIKIGVTNRKLHYRLKEINKTLPEHMRKFSVVNSFTADGQYIYDSERYILEACAPFKHDVYFSGNTETFSGIDFSRVLGMFIGLKKMSPAIKTITPRPKRKPMTSTEIMLKRRESILEKTGVPVGVVINQGAWAFQVTRRTPEGVKYKKVVGKFDTKDQAVEFAHHYYATGEFLATKNNRLVYNKNGWLLGVQKVKNRYLAVVSFSLIDGNKRNKKHVGSFVTVEEAEAAIIAFKADLANGVYGEVAKNKYE